MTTTSRIRTLLAALAVSLAVPALALADAPNDAAPHATKGDKAKKGKGERKRNKGDKGEKANFPMAGKDFLARVEGRLTKMKERVESHLAKSDAPEAKKKEVRETFAKSAARIRAAAKKAAADDTVTKEEAKTVHQVAREARKEARGKHAKGKKKGGDKKGRRNKGNKKSA